jgi:sugar/nucleoside kinase (ribokinase family)
VSLLVVGSVAFDAVETPFGKRERMLGGSATHFSLAASFFTEVRVVGVVGSDFGEAEMDVFRARNIDTSDIERVESGNTFFWRGRYDFDLNTAHTLDTQLNVFAEFQPKLSDAAKNSRFVFLGNIQPDLQREVRGEVPQAQLVALDTMNYWIESARESLVKTIGVVDVMIINDAEARQLSGESNLHRAAARVREMGPKTLIIKRGEYGAAMFSDAGYFAIPAYPLESGVRPDRRWRHLRGRTARLPREPRHD